MDEVIGRLSGIILFLLFFSGFVCMLIAEYYHFKMESIVREKLPDVAELIYDWKSPGFNRENWIMLNKFNNAEYPEIAEYVRRRNFFILLAIICGLLIVVAGVILIILFII